MPSPGPVDVILPSRARRIEQPYFDFLPFVVPRQPLLLASLENEEVRSKIVTPYNADAFESLLSKYDLMNIYPHLVRNLRNGFPLGEFPDLDKHVIFPPHKPSAQYQKDIDPYLEDEVSAGRMDGPFSFDETTSILRGPFQCSPIVVDVQQDKLRICCHLSKGNKDHPSTNSFIDTERFPTRFGSAAEMADIVSTPTHLPFFPYTCQRYTSSPYEWAMFPSQHPGAHSPHS